MNLSINEYGYYKWYGANLDYVDLFAMLWKEEIIKKSEYQSIMWIDENDIC